MSVFLAIHQSCIVLWLRRISIENMNYVQHVAEIDIRTSSTPNSLGKAGKLLHIYAFQLLAQHGCAPLCTQNPSTAKYADSRVCLFKDNESPAMEESETNLVLLKESEEEDHRAMSSIVCSKVHLVFLIKRSALVLKNSSLHAMNLWILGQSESSYNLRCCL